MYWVCSAHSLPLFKKMGLTIYPFKEESQGILTGILQILLRTVQCQAPRYHLVLTLDSVITEGGEREILRLPKAGDIVFEVLKDPKSHYSVYGKRKFLFTKFAAEASEVSFGNSEESDCKFDCETISSIHAKFSKRNGKVFIKPAKTQFGTAIYKTKISIFPHQEYQLQINNSLLTITLRKVTPKKYIPKPLPISPSKSPQDLKRKHTLEFQEDHETKKRKVSTTGLICDEFSGTHRSF